MEHDRFKKALNDFGDEYIKELTKQLIQADKVATGNLIKSLDYQVIEKIEGQFQLIIEASEYLKWVDKGRRASGKMPPVKPFIKWVTARGIRFKKSNGLGFLTKEQTAFVIAKSLKSKNIRPTNVLKKTIGNVMNMKSKILKDGAMKDFEELAKTILTVE